MVVQPKQLEQLVLVWRHGDRSPVNVYPNFEKDFNGPPSKFFPFGLGQLSDIGINQHYELGKFLKTRYSNFLPKRFNSSEIYYQSSDIDRTLMSAEANSMGMFSNSETSDKLDLPRPVPIHTVPHKYAETIITDLTDFKKECPAYGKLYDKIHQTHSYKHALKLWNSKLPNFKEWSGYPKFNFHNLEHFFDSLQCAVAHDLQMPSWFNQQIFETIKSGAAIRHYLKFTDLDHEYQDQVARLTTGGLIKSIQTDFLEKKYKFKAYSAHDTNLVGIMAALGEYNFKVPGYASAFIFERYDDESVKWLFRNDTNVEGVYEMKLCEDKFELGCSLAEWRYETEELISKDWKKECGMGGLFDGVSMVLVWGLIFSWVFILRKTI